MLWVLAYDALLRFVFEDRVMITGYTNPRFATPDGLSVDISLTLPSGETVPFTAHPDDPEPHGAEIYRTIAANAGNIPIAPYAPPSSSDQVPSSPPGSPMRRLA